ncbi:MAG: helicase-exonuclease AddAB subunit AddA [Bacillota bacterium]|nr:helicase-exonuclease AddAB subunit AddA [Bacillota bacterium]
MSNTRWTEEQESAIYTRGSNLLVAAAAGSGKTAVLVERIIKMVTDNEKSIDIDKLLVVTFTKAAASEMRERIAKAISDELYKHPESRLLQRQLTLLNKSNITTIHSFCLDVIKSNFHLVDLDPSFRIADETETVLLKDEVMEELLEDRYSSEKELEDFLKFVESYSSNRDDSAVEAMIFELHNFVMSCPWPKEWLDQMVEEFNVDSYFDFGQSKWARVLLRNITIELKGIKSSMENAIDIINNVDSLQPYLENFNEELVFINDLISSSESGWNALEHMLNNTEFRTLKRCGKDVDKTKQEIVKDIRDKAKKHINNIKDELFIFSNVDVIEDLREIYPLLKVLSQLVLDFDNRYKSKKKRNGIIDFNDIEHLCLRILTMKDEAGGIIPSDIALELRKKYEEVLIDEYQDSNIIQEQILGTVSRKETENPNVFMVGDVKQSIYRFRQAKPELFLEKYNSYSLEKGSKNRKILLYKNFRSRKEILDATNYIFKLIMSESIGELNYTQEESLNLGANYEETHDTGIIGGKVEINLIEKDNSNTHDSIEEINENSEEEDKEEALDNIQLEARVVAKKILELIGTDKDGNHVMVRDKNTNQYRPIQYKDIVILLRATSNWAEVYMDEFKKYDIPIYADTSSGYFDTAEIQTVMSLLQIVDNPRQDIPLLSVLRSPVAAFSQEELIDIRALCKDAAFYDTLKMAASKWIGENNEEAVICDPAENDIDMQLCKKCHYFLARLNVWRNKAPHMSIDEFIWYLYTDTGYYGYAGAMPNGLQRQANLKILFQRAKQYEQTSYRGLFNFVNFINKLRVSSGDMGSAKIIGENENVVRIMSIHKSKGLEFPVVILSGTGKNFNLRDINKKLLLHYELGFGPDYINYEKRLSYPTLLKQALKRKIKLESLSEEMRILYVALTRAKERLVITGMVNNIEKTCSKWASTIDGCDKISEDVILRGRSFLDWIGPAIIRHNDAEKLRNTALITDSKGIISDESKWHIELWDRKRAGEYKTENADSDGGFTEEILPEDAVLDNIKEILTGNIEPSQYSEEIERRLSWEYNYIEASKLPSLISVTELKRQFDDGDEYTVRFYDSKILKRPAFLEKNKGLTAAERGTAMHSIMQHLVLDSEITKDYIKSQIETMVNNEILTKIQAESVNTDKLLRFFKSNIGERMLKSKCIMREVPFQIRLSSREIYKNIHDPKYNNEFIVVQGAIDCYFEEDDEVILVDYKTDYIDDNNIDEITNKYKTQLKYYSDALEKITGKKVREKFLYFFSSGNGVLIK